MNDELHSIDAAEYLVSKVQWEINCITLARRGYSLTVRIG